MNTTCTITIFINRMKVWKCPLSPMRNSHKVKVSAFERMSDFYDFLVKEWLTTSWVAVTERDSGGSPERAIFYLLNNTLAYDLSSLFIILIYQQIALNHDLKFKLIWLLSQCIKCAWISGKWIFLKSVNLLLCFS